MITQRPSSLHTRDREIAAMPLATDDDRAEHWAVSLALWIFMATVLIVPCLIFA